MVVLLVDLAGWNYFVSETIHSISTMPDPSINPTCCRSNARSVVNIGKPCPVRLAYLLVNNDPRGGNVRTDFSI